MDDDIPGHLGELDEYAATHGWGLVNHGLLPPAQWVLGLRTWMMTAYKLDAPNLYIDTIRYGVITEEELETKLIAAMRQLDEAMPWPLPADDDGAWVDAIPGFRRIGEA